MDSPSLDDKVIKRVQAIAGEILFYVQEVDNKVLVAFNNIGNQQTAAT